MANIRVEFEIMEDCAMQIAYAICKKYICGNNGDKEKAIIDLEEVAEHILAFTKAEKNNLITNLKRGGRQ